ncbi:uncharacterized protein LOC115878447, partial [Sitophilus oryzae]|uniref:Uncharacterized protein LOC115878447 n=1 Tax=Sitophilus oryzae TaxID=7048 RepID=A0A6J2XHR1_SITOR
VDSVADYIKSNKTLNLEYNRNCAKYISSEWYQLNVRYELNVIYERHILLLSYADVLCNSFITRLVICSLMCLGISILPLITSFVSMFKGCEIIIVVASVVIMTVVITHEFFNMGQALEDQFQMIYSELLNVSWYYWNSRNKKSYIVILTQSQKTVTFYSGFATKGNMESFLKYGRFLYGGLNFLYQMK